jgi:LacI family transcriptional regulator
MVWGGRNRPDRQQIRGVGEVFQQKRDSGLHRKSVFGDIVHQMPRIVHVTLAQIAEEAGVARATVSYALREHPKIPIETALRVRRAAERLGYQPNPQVSSLMAHIRRGRPLAQGERIAFLWLHARPGLRTFPFIFAGARRRAEQLGYALEEFWLDEPGMSHVRLGQIIRARGITGLVISPILEGLPHFTINWDWTQFAPAIVGNAGCTPELHHAGFHHFMGMRTALLALQQAGAQRIAAVVDLDINERTKRALSSAFVAHSVNPERAPRWIRVQTHGVMTGIVSWLRKLGPDAVITHCWLAQRLTDLHPALIKKLPIAVLDRRPGECAWPGIDQGEEVIAANAVDLVVGQLLRNERGAPEHVKMLFFPGRWIAGPSAPPAG